MVAQPSSSPPQKMSVAQWRELERNSHDIKHEYIDGRAYAVSGGSRDHGQIGGNTVRALEDAIGDTCYVYNSDVAARLSSSRYTYPDATVTCDKRDQPTDDTEILAPRVIVEVLSPSTEAYDRGDKFGYYRVCPTIQEYVLIATKAQGVDVFRRTDHGWSIYQHYGPDDTLELESVGVSIPVAALYRRTDVPMIPDEPVGEV
jgi:Uma2 family endonuclease